MICELVKLIDTQIELLKTEMMLPQESRYVKDTKLPELHWTASPTEFIELSKALFLADCFNNGTKNYKEVFSILCSTFGIEIQNPHTSYTKMKERKSDRTIFLSKLKAVLERDMDEKDYK